MKVLIVSDTHGRDRELEQVVLRETPFNMLIHCGDVEGREFYIEALAECDCCIVAGNNDFFSDLDREQEISIGGKRALITHGHYYGVSMDISGIVEEAKDRGCELVFFGHTHKPVVVEKDGVLAVNPGSLAYPRQSDHKPSYAVLETNGKGEVKVHIKYLG